MGERILSVTNGVQGTFNCLRRTGPYDVAQIAILSLSFLSLLAHVYDRQAAHHTLLQFPRQAA